MNSTKLVQVLKKLTKKEFRALKKNLHTLFFKDQKVRNKSLALFKIIAPYYPDFENSRLDKEKVYHKLYPGEAYKTGKLEKQISSLFATVQDFIVLQHSAKKKDIDQSLTLSVFYRSRGLHNLAEISNKRYLKAILKSDYKDSTYYYDAFVLEKQNARYQKLYADTNKSLSLNSAMKNLDEYFILEKLEMACQILSIHRFVFPVDLGQNLEILDRLLPLFESGYFDAPTIHVYHSAYLLLRVEKEEAESKFLAFEKELKKHYDKVPKEHLIMLNTMIRNYCIMQYNKGLKGYLEKGFEYYKEHLKKGYLYDEGKLFASTMGNLVLSGLRLKQFAWVLQFLQEHENRITGTTTPQMVFKFNLANYYFYTSDYEKALDLVMDTDEDTYYKLRMKRLEIKIYYEMKHVLLSPKIDAFKILVYRFSLKRITPNHKEGNRNFIDLLKQIYLPSTFQNQKRIDKLLTKVKTLKFITEKEWLLEKLETLR